MRAAELVLLLFFCKQRCEMYTSLCVCFRRSGCKMLFCLDNSELRSTPRCRSIPSEHHLHTQALPWAVTTVKQQQKRKGCQQQLNKELRTVAATNDDGDSKASPNAGSDFETKMLPHKATDPESSKEEQTGL